MRDRASETKTANSKRTNETDDKQKIVQEKTWSRKARRGDSEVPH